MKPNLRYPPAEQKKRMAQFEKWVKRARSDWRAGYAVMLIPYAEWLDLAGLQPTYIHPASRTVGPSRRKSR